MKQAAVIAACALAAGAAWAGEGDAIDSHRFQLDLFHGPVLASSRIVSLGGAYVGVAEGVDGLFYNPAAVANRYPYSLDWWDWDVDVGFVFPTALGSADFDNDGVVQQYESAATATLGGSLQFGRLGFGLEASILGYGVTVEDPISGAPATANVDVTTAHADIAYGFSRGQWLVGLGIRAGSFEVGPNVGEVSGAGLEAGLLLRPDALPFRLGASVRAPIRSDENTLLADGWKKPDPDADPPEPGDPPAEKTCARTTPVRGLWVPCRLLVPWEVSAGASWRFGRAATNEPWVNPKEEGARIAREAEAAAERRRARTDAAIAEIPEEERAALAEVLRAEDRRIRNDEIAAARRGLAEADAARRARSAARVRRYLLVSASLTATGPSSEALGIEAFIVQREFHSGQEVSFTPAVGLETEVVPNLLRLRGGSYLEPTRFADTPTRDAAPRLHGTGGLDLRLFQWDVFGIFSPFSLKAGSMIDLAPHWLNFSVGVGIWH